MGQKVRNFKPCRYCHNPNAEVQQSRSLHKEYVGYKDTVSDHAVKSKEECSKPKGVRDEPKVLACQVKNWASHYSSQSRHPKNTPHIGKLLLVIGMDEK